MSIDHIVMIVIGFVGVLVGLYALSEAKAYRVRHHASDKSDGAHPAA